MSESDGSGSNDDDATVKAASAIAESTAGTELTRDEKRIAGPIVHYAFGSTVGAIYGALAEYLPMTSRGWGLPFGVALWLVADEVGVPLAGLGPSPEQTPAAVHASALTAHLAYGAAADGVRRAVRAALA